MSLSIKIFNKGAQLAPPAETLMYVHGKPERFKSYDCFGGICYCAQCLSLSITHTLGCQIYLILCSTMTNTVYSKMDYFFLLLVFVLYTSELYFWYIFPPLVHCLFLCILIFFPTLCASQQMHHIYTYLTTSSKAYNT